MSICAGVTFGTIEAFRPELVGGCADFEAITTMRRESLLVPTRLRIGLRFWFGAERVLSGPCGFRIYDPKARDCSRDLHRESCVFWWGSWSETARVTSAIEALMADEALPGRWRLVRKANPDHGLHVLRDGRGRAALPRSSLPLQPRKPRARPLATSSKYGWETMRGGETRGFSDVTVPLLHAHFRAWARRRGVTDRKIRVHTLAPGICSVEMLTWHGSGARGPGGATD